MKSSRAALLVSAVLCLSGVALFAQDPVKVDPTHYKVILENSAVRVLRITYAAGSKSVMHQHPDAIVVAMSGGKVNFKMPDGTSRDQDLPKDSALYTPAGKHLPTNTGTAVMSAILVEFKGAAPGTAVLPMSRPGLTMTTLAEGPRATAYKVTTSPTFAEPAGTKHAFDQVIIALSPAQITVAVEGQPAKTNWARGDVLFIGRGVAHESKNIGGKPVDDVIVAIK
jgi:quercetin dioxygenase-like cupin family protein